jgi:hypothetical protein
MSKTNRQEGSTHTETDAGFIPEVNCDDFNQLERDIELHSLQNGKREETLTALVIGDRPPAAALMAILGERRRLYFPRPSHIDPRIQELEHIDLTSIS